MSKKLLQDQHLVEILKKDPDIERLNLSSNCLSTQSAGILATWLNQNNALTQLNLSGNHQLSSRSSRFTSSIAQQHIIPKIIAKSKLTEINLAYTGLDQWDVRDIENYLASKKTGSLTVHLWEPDNHVQLQILNSHRQLADKAVTCRPWEFHQLESSQSKDSAKSSSSAMEKDIIDVTYLMRKSDHPKPKEVKRIYYSVPGDQEQYFAVMDENYIKETHAVFLSPSPYKAIKSYPNKMDASMLKFVGWYNSELVQWLIAMVNNRATCIRVVFEESPRENDKTFKYQLGQLIRLTQLLNKPALFVSKEPGNTNHFVVGLIQHKRLLLINPLGEKGKTIACTRILAELQRDGIIEHVCLSQDVLQTIEFDGGHLVSCGPITLAIAVHILTNLTQQQLEDHLEQAVANDSNIRKSNGEAILTYHLVEIDPLLSETLRALKQLIHMVALSKEPPGMVEKNKYQEILLVLRHRHFHQTFQLATTKAAALNISIDDYLNAFNVPGSVQHGAWSQIVFKKLIPRTVDLNLMQVDSLSAAEQEWANKPNSLLLIKVQSDFSSEPAFYFYANRETESTLLNPIKPLKEVDFKQPVLSVSLIEKHEIYQELESKGHKLLPELTNDEIGTFYEYDQLKKELALSPETNVEPIEPFVELENLSVPVSEPGQTFEKWFGVTRKEACDLLIKQVNRDGDHVILFLLLRMMTFDLLKTRSFADYLFNQQKLSDIGQENTIDKYQEVINYTSNANIDVARKVIKMAIDYTLNSENNESWLHPALLQAIAISKNVKIKIWETYAINQLIEYRIPYPLPPIDTQKILHLLVIKKSDNWQCNALNPLVTIKLPKTSQSSRIIPKLRCHALMEQGRFDIIQSLRLFDNFGSEERKELILPLAYYLGYWHDRYANPWEVQTYIKQLLELQLVPRYQVTEAVWAGVNKKLQEKAQPKKKQAPEETQTKQQDQQKPNNMLHLPACYLDHNGWQFGLENYLNVNLFSFNLLTHLNLSDNQLTNHSIKLLTERLKDEAALTYLNLSHNPLGGKAGRVLIDSGIQHLARALPKLPELTKLLLNGCFIDQTDVVALTKELTTLQKSKLKTLGLNHNQLGSSVEALFPLLEGKKTYQSIEFLSPEALEKKKDCDLQPDVLYLAKVVNDKDSDITICRKDEASEQAKTNGCDLYSMSSFPGEEDLEPYKNSYILVEKELRYVMFNGKYEGNSVPITQIEHFLEGIGKINSEHNKKHLSNQQIKDLITSNGGHTQAKEAIKLSNLEPEVTVEISKLLQKPNAIISRFGWFNWKTEDESRLIDEISRQVGYDNPVKLKKLHLLDNSLTDEDGDKLNEVLGRNKDLKCLALEGNTPRVASETTTSANHLSEDTLGPIRYKLWKNRGSQPDDKSKFAPEYLKQPDPSLWKLWEKAEKAWKNYVQAVGRLGSHKYNEIEVYFKREKFPKAKERKEYTLYLLKVCEGNQVELEVYPYHDNDDDYKRDSHETLCRICELTPYFDGAFDKKKPHTTNNEQEVESLVQRYNYTGEGKYLAELRNTYEKAATKITSYLRRSQSLRNLFNFNRFLRRDFTNMMLAFRCIASVLIKPDHKTEVSEYGEAVGKGSEVAAMIMEALDWPGLIAGLTKGIGMVFEFACKEIAAEQQIKRIQKLLKAIDYCELDEALFVSHLALQLTMMYQMTALALPEEPPEYELLLMPSLPEKNLAAYLQAYEDTYILVKSPSKLIYVTTAGEHENIPIKDEKKLLANIQSINPNNSSELRLSQQQFELFITKNGGYNPFASAHLIKRSIESMEKFVIDNSVPSPLKQFVHFVSTKLIVGFLKGDLGQERYQAKPLESNDFIKLNDLTDRLTALVLSPSDSIWEKIKQNAAKAVGLQQVKLKDKAAHPRAGKSCDLESLCSAAALYDPSEDKYYSRTASNGLTQVQLAGYISCRAKPYVQWFKFQPALFNWKDHKKLTYKLVFKPEENAAAMEESTQSASEMKLNEAITVLKNELDKTKTDIANLEKTNKAKYDELKENYDNKIQELENRIKELESKIKELEKNQTAPKDEANKSKEALNAQPENQTEIPQQGITNHHDSVAMEKLLEKFVPKAEFESLKAENTNLKQEVITVKKENADLNERITTLDKELAKMQRQIDLLNGKPDAQIAQPAPVNLGVVPVVQPGGGLPFHPPPLQRVPIPPPETNDDLEDAISSEDEAPLPNTSPPKPQ